MGFAETQDEFLPRGSTERSSPAADHDLIRRLARERMLAREGAAGPSGPAGRGRWFLPFSG
ncbi:hypothetical protein [Falsiroseomonas sp.]|uniref:hypothetical protein n=1 Tax=Falsiroseomonas sp. TaxID=2870721 RepID=UPI003564D91E